jgi:hypothetical protein
VLAGGCGAATFVARDGMFRHRTRGFAVPDLTLESWDRVRIKGADLAFRDPIEGVIALRVRCDRDAVRLESESRDFWLGIPRSGTQRRTREVAGWPAFETRAQSDGRTVHTVVIGAGECVVDVAHVAPAEALPSETLERFLDRFRRPGEP